MDGRVVSDKGLLFLVVVDGSASSEVAFIVDLSLAVTGGLTLTGWLLLSPSLPSAGVSADSVLLTDVVSG